MKPRQKKLSNVCSQRLSRSATGQRSRERGVALLITLGLLALLGAASLAMVLLASSDTMINGYYRNYRGSFYAADSGVNVVVETMRNAIQNAASNANNPPLPTGAIPATVSAAYAPFMADDYTVSDNGSWKEQFRMIANPGGALVLGAPRVDPPFDPLDPQHPLTYTYPYTVTVKGKSYLGAEEITETGTIVYYIDPGAAAGGALPRFSKWGAFIDEFAACKAPLVQGTITGPVFTNGQWNFGNYSNPGYTFTDTVGQKGTEASWFTNKGCVNSATAPNGFKKPVFKKGFQLGQDEIKPPSTSYSQIQAVLDGKGSPPCTSAPCSPDPPPSQARMNQVLKTIDGTSYPSSGTAPTGVYIPWYTNASGDKVFGCDPANPANGGDGAGGGFYVKGDASSIDLLASTGGDGTTNPTQTYTIKQGGTTTTIVVNNTTGKTTVSSGGTNLILKGTPTQLDPNTRQPITQADPSGNAVNPTLVYVDGQITKLSGTVQNLTGITIAASDNINITGDLTYVQSPVSIPSDALNSSTNAGVLGIYTTANINLYPNSSGTNRNNLTVDASLAAIGSGTSGFATPGNSINTWTIVGGRSEDQAHSVNIGTGNTYYDQRFAGNFGPPWFPTSVLQPGQNGAPPSHSITVMRSSWKENRR
ncbi:MAG TPA: hypothetical protein VM578_06835 [Candidatus Saccharimonadales bacterium]|nr:hypothetical protein [Candidatus Saccharimonadales bacterium]